ncbi:MAG: protease modulator HflK family protein [Proteobacteria bacterium]|nr:protease modulator HflK family protein [Pseudomonadota bacterium]
MKQSIKGASVAFVVIVSLTLTKFVLYFVSGSIAVLSEAWHSFTDIATTLLVLISIARQEHKNRNHTNEKPLSDSSSRLASNQQKEASPSGPKKVYRWIRGINTELKISTIIGFVLIFAASMILWRALVSEPTEIYAPLTTGIVFIVLSFGSFFLYRFEETLGKEENSAALTADSHHNRADMVISLLTGISLIIYYFGTNLDRWIGIVISLYILVFSIELLFNTFRAIYYNKQDVVFDYRFIAIIQKLFHPQSYKALLNRIEDRTKLGDKTRLFVQALPGIASRIGTWSVRLAMITAVVFYVSTMFYTINPDEKALVTRFGKVINQQETISPGLHWKLPYPIDSIIVFQTERINSLTVGNKSAEDLAMIWTKEHGDNLTFISGDNNLFLPYIVIHYRIKDVYPYYLLNRNGVPEKLLESLSYRLLNRVFSQTSFYDLILTRRSEWTAQFKDLLQIEADRLDTGLEIVEFCVKDLHPPIELAGEYEAVVAADQKKETLVNTAQRLENTHLSRARMQAFESVTEAEGYRIKKKYLAEGEASNYLLRYQGYKAGGKLTQNLLLLKTAEKSLENKKIVLVDENSGIDKKLIYIEKHMAGRNRQ